LPAHATGSGKVLLSYLPEEEIDYLYPDEILPARTSRTITSKKELKIALKEIRKNGFAFDDQESDQEIWAVASCIRNDRGYPVAAISVVAPIFRVKERDHHLWGKYVQDGALEVSKKLGFRPS
jgi:DNA-binding IclR family transcriptional regulator